MDRDRSLDIAVTGIAARFPGVPDLAAWWSALLAGTVLTSRLRRDDLIAAGVPAALADDPDYVPVRGLLTDADRFDNEVFRVSPRDAEMMDPQHRMMLEVAWSALEDSGADPAGGGPVTAVFAAGTGSGYLRAMLARGPLDPATLDQAIHGTEPDFIAGLISYKLGLTGPALAVQTACSSGLVGVHLAAQALLNGDCDRALIVASGMDYPQAGHLHMPGGIQSRSGECRPFDAAADGVVAGSGVVCVVLRRLADAHDGPPPHGILLGTAINNDGAAKAGYYAPSVGGQEAVIHAAYDNADITADSVGYLETHGTGTRVGDPIEWLAAAAALTELGAAPGQIAIGALKANTGHLDAAAGLAALVKALFVVREGIVPPVAGFSTMNPLLENDNAPLYVPVRAGEWSGPEPRRAGVSSFGIGGTNAHVLVEQPPPITHHRTAAAARLVVLSARDRATLARSADRLAAHLTAHDPDPADVAHTLATGRAVFGERIAVAGRGITAIAAALTGNTGVRGTSPSGPPAPLIFVFPGQGTQSPGMARPLAGTLPAFPAALDETLAAFEPALAARLRSALLDPDFPASELDRTELAQPALFAIEYAATIALAGLGVRPAGVAGHSLGEITAACVAGVIDLRSAAALVVARGRAMQDCPAGAMLAIGVGERKTRMLLAQTALPVELAAVNGPDNCVLAGAADDVVRLQERLTGRVFVRRLRTNRAFHSSRIEPALPALTDALAGLDTAPATLPMGCNSTGLVLAAGERMPASMFVDAARQPVRFGAALSALARELPGALAVEVGPGRVLSAMSEAVDVHAVPLCPARGAHPGEEVLTAIGVLWTRGQPVDLATLCGAGRPIHLPGYAFGGPRWLAPEVAATPAPADDVAAIVDESTSDAGELVAQLWSELLGRQDLTDESDFFELGGDSLLITHLARRIRTSLGVRVPLRDMLAGRTLGRQTTLVRELVTATTD